VKTLSHRRARRGLSTQCRACKGSLASQLRSKTLFAVLIPPTPHGARPSRLRRLRGEGLRAPATILSVEDPRYRPLNQKGGELLLWMVDGAKNDGTGGTMRALLKGALGWAASLFGMTIAIGDSKTTTVTITGSTLIKLVGPVELKGSVTIDGDLTVNGNTSVQNINIAGTETGGGSG
jgi:hypothetical protein